MIDRRLTRSARAGLIAVLGLCAIAHYDPAAAGSVRLSGSRAAADASARTAHVTMPGTYFSPSRVSVLSGDTVSWKDLSVLHTVTGDTWSSGTLSYGDTFDHQFSRAGTYPYYCQIHPFMTGTVAVYDLLLDRANATTSPGQPYRVHGRSALPEGTEVAIDADAGGGFQTVASTTVRADGTFTASVTPTTTTRFRARHGTLVSQILRVRVVNRVVRVSDRRRDHRDYVNVRVLPGAPGSRVVLQLHLRERFGWWPVARKRLDHASRARFVVRRSGRTRARVVLTLSDGWTPLAVSRVLLLGARR